MPTETRSSTHTVARRSRRTAIQGFRFISNAARHNAYGINGYFFTFGLGILTAYYPGYVWETNYLAGGPDAQYPVLTLVQSPFEDQFVNVAAGNYTVRPGSVLKRAASDGTDIGADYPTLLDALDGVEAGRAARSWNTRRRCRPRRRSPLRASSLSARSPTRRLLERRRSTQFRGTSGRSLRRDWQHHQPHVCRRRSRTR